MYDRTDVWFSSCLFPSLTTRMIMLKFFTALHESCYQVNKSTLENFCAQPPKRFNFKSSFLPAPHINMRLWFFFLSLLFFNSLKHLIFSCMKHSNNGIREIFAMVVKSLKIILHLPSNRKKLKTMSNFSRNDDQRLFASSSSNHSHTLQARNYFAFFDAFQT